MKATLLAIALLLAAVDAAAQDYGSGLPQLSDTVLTTGVWHTSCSALDDFTDFSQTGASMVLDYSSLGQCDFHTTTAWRYASLHSAADVGSQNQWCKGQIVTLVTTNNDYGCVFREQSGGNHVYASFLQQYTTWQYRSHESDHNNTDTNGVSGVTYCGCTWVAMSAGDYFAESISGDAGTADRTFTWYRRTKASGDFNGNDPNNWTGDIVCACDETEIANGLSTETATWIDGDGDCGVDSHSNSSTESTHTKIQEFSCGSWTPP